MFIFKTSLGGSGKTAKGVLRDQFTVNWFSLLRLITAQDQGKLKLFTVRYVFQAIIHSIWRERNRRRHGEKPSPEALLIKLIDKTVRNKFTIVQRKGDKSFEGGLA